MKIFLPLHSWTFIICIIFFLFSYWYTFLNIISSGTINVEGVDDFENDPALQSRGYIGIDLRKNVTRDPTSAEICRDWVTEQSDMGRKRSRCQRPCAPTLSLASFASRGRFRGLRKIFKNRQNGFLPNFCVFSSSWRLRDGADLCCYTYFGSIFLFSRSIISQTYDGFFLDSSRSQGASHWYPVHPNRNSVAYNEEEEMYSTCCTKEDSTTESCSEYYSIRPVCNSESWIFPTIWCRWLVIKLILNNRGQLFKAKLAAWVKIQPSVFFVYFYIPVYVETLTGENSYWSRQDFINKLLRNLAQG
jgi:hypothetical protein